MYGMSVYKLDIGGRFGMARLVAVRSPAEQCSRKVPIPFREGVDDKVFIVEFLACCDHTPDWRQWFEITDI